MEDYLISISTKGDISIWNLKEIMSIEKKIVLENFAALFEYKIESRLVLLDAIISEKIVKKERTQ